MFGWFSLAKVFLSISKLIDAWKRAFQMREARDQGAKDQQLRSQKDVGKRKDKQAQAAANMRRHTRSPRALARWLRGGDKDG